MIFSLLKIINEKGSIEGSFIPLQTARRSHHGIEREKRESFGSKLAKFRIILWLKSVNRKKDHKICA